MSLRTFIWKVITTVFILLVLIDMVIFLYSGVVLNKHVKALVERQLEDIRNLMNEIIKEAKKRFAVMYEWIPMNSLSKLEKDLLTAKKYTWENGLVFEVVQVDKKLAKKVYYDFNGILSYIRDHLNSFEIRSSPKPDRSFLKIDILGKDLYILPEYVPELEKIPAVFMGIHISALIMLALITTRYLMLKMNESFLKPIKRFIQALENLEVEGEAYLVSDPSYLKDFEKARVRFNSAISKLAEKINDLTSKVTSLKKDLEVMVQGTGMILQLERKTGFREAAKTILEMAVNTIPTADAGSVYIREKGSAYLIASIGYKDEFLKGIKLPPYPSTKPTMINWRVSQNSMNLPLEVSKRFELAGADDLSVSLFCPIKYKGEIVGEFWLDSLKSQKFEKMETKMAEFFASLLSIFYGHELETSNLKSSFLNILTQISLDAEIGKPYLERGHSSFVSDNAMMLSKYLGHSRSETSLIRLAGLLHDIGKIALPMGIYSSPNISHKEFELIKTHTTVGFEILSRIKGMHDLAECVLYHHERWDGKGFPHGLKGEEIPLCSRIISVVNAFDNLKRPKKFGINMSPSEALKFIKENEGKIWDPDVADAAYRYFGRLYGS